MNYRRLIMPAIAGLALMSPARAVLAQRAGTVELGGFGQLERVDEVLQTKNQGVGAGGRLGIFFSPRWELEADASFTQLDALAGRGGNAAVKAGDKVQANYYVGRLNYNIPWGARPGNAVILSAGAGANRIDNHSDFVVSPAVGLRAMLGNVVGLRFDVLSTIAPNATNGSFRGPAVSTVTNFGARAGVSLLLNNGRRAVPAPVVAAPVDDGRARQDSIDRANRLRQDSIDAANRRAQDSVNAARAAAERALAEARALLNASVYFDYDKSEIRGDAKAALDAKLPLLQANPSLKIRIEGNTDSRGSNEYNMALGLRRANAARRYLVSQGIDNGRFEVASLGEERPADQGTSDEAFTKNRRDDFVITVGGDDISLPR